MGDLPRKPRKKTREDHIFYELFALFLPPNLVKTTSVIHLARGLLVASVRSIRTASDKQNAFLSRLVQIAV